jgi:soluble lytic murein transglycosylase-like protein
MIISRDHDALLKIISSQKIKNIKSSSTPELSGKGFHNVLKGLIQEKQSVSIGSSAICEKINREQLMFFIKAMQIQMNSRLYNSLFNHELETSELTNKIMLDYKDNITRLIPEASKNSQESPRKILAGDDGILNQIINQAAQKYDVDADLIRSVIKVESNFNASATSLRGAMGLMQLMPETARELGVKNAYDARDNVMGGTRYLKMLLERYDGHVDLALAAYNWGMGNVEKHPDRLPTETIGYIAKVNSYYKSTKA